MDTATSSATFRGRATTTAGALNGAGRRVGLIVLLASSMLLHGCVETRRITSASPPVIDAPDTPVALDTEADRPSTAAPPPSHETGDLRALLPGAPPICRSPLLDAIAASVSAMPPAPPPPDLWQQLRDNMAIDPVDNAKVARDRRWWVRHRAALDDLLSRGSHLLPYLWQAVEERGLPAELALLPAVESRFNPYAYSREGAVGLWQLMPATGRRYGLQLSWWYDGRRDLVAATDAALTHLQWLHRKFDGNWLHVLAAYNAGARKVSRAIRKNRELGKATDFWHLDLPGETDRYVPRLLALADVVRNPSRYGIELPEATSDIAFVRVDTGGQIDLGVAARLAGIDIDELMALNGGFNRVATPPQGPHRLLVPEGIADRFRAGLAALPDTERMRWRRHKIESGETLSHIAQRHGVAVDAIKRANRLQSHRIRAGRDLFIPLSSRANDALANGTTLERRNKVHYRVRKGDSLYLIARRYKVKISSLRRWNALNGKYLHPGQQLVVYIDPTRQTL